MKNFNKNILFFLIFCSSTVAVKPEKYTDLEKQTKKDFFSLSKETVCKLKLTASIATTAGLTYYGANGYPALLPAAGVPATMSRIYLRGLTESIEFKYKATAASLMTIGGFISDLKFLPLGMGAVGLGWLTNMGKRAEKVKLKTKNKDIESIEKQIKELQEQLKDSQKQSNELVEVKVS